MKLPWLLLGACAAGCGPLYLRAAMLEFQSDTSLAGKSGTWAAVEVPDAPSPPKVWMQQGKGESSQFNLSLYEISAPQNGEVRVQLRAVEGETDRGGGIVWRATDEKNYYLVRWNPLEQNVRAYKVVDGTRTQLLEKQTKAGAGWHELRVWFLREKYEIWFDGDSLGEHTDTTFLTLGKVGLWTKADARTQFDDLEILEF